MEKGRGNLEVITKAFFSFSCFVSIQRVYWSIEQVCLVHVQLPVQVWCTLKMSLLQRPAAATDMDSLSLFSYVSHDKGTKKKQNKNNKKLFIHMKYSFVLIITQTNLNLSINSELTINLNKIPILCEQLIFLGEKLVFCVHVLSIVRQQFLISRMPRLHVLSSSQSAAWTAVQPGNPTTDILIKRLIYLSFSLTRDSCGCHYQFAALQASNHTWDHEAAAWRKLGRSLRRIKESVHGLFVVEAPWRRKHDVV